jgi:uncharacterized integral membrane protein
MLKALKLLFSLVLALVLTVFAVKNSRVVPIDLWPLPLQFNLTLSLVILGCFAVGMGFGALLVWMSHLINKLMDAKHNDPPVTPK